MPRPATSCRAPFRPIVTLGDAAAEPLDADRLARALGDANVPTLVAVLTHLTGEERWFHPPYTPTRTKGLSDHTSGGLTEQARAAVRAAALAAVLRWADDPDGIRALDEGALGRIMELCMGEPVAPKYVGMMAEEMGMRPRFDNERLARLRPDEEYSAVIVGAGASGICMAVQLKQANIPFTIVEKNPTVGGTWYENRYPDCGVDTPSYWYSFSFNPVSWSHYYSKRDDVQAYLDATVDRFGLREHILFDTCVDAASYDAATDTWHVRATGPDDTQVELDARFLVTAVGQLNQPKIPSIPGQETFAHDQFHSARWPADLSLRGKRVAVVGTGASAMQLVPAIADEVAELTVFQRSPQWIAPNPEYTREVSDDTRYLMAHVPFYAAWYRMRQAWVFGDKVYDNLVIDPDWSCTDTAVNSINDGYRRYFTSYIRSELEGRPDLLEKALPDYPPFGKRMLLDSGWFRALRLPHVSLETTPIESIGTDAIRTKDGVDHEVDVIVYATGFDSLRLLGSFDVRGRDGVALRDQWGDDDARAYLGMTEHGFPNMFFLYGPNTNLGHGGSLLFITECHVRYIMGLIEQLIQRGGTSLECRQDLRDRHNDEIDQAHAGLIWSHPGMQTWYRNDRGRVVTNSPWRLIDLWQMTRAPRLDDYEVV
ncbi:MAG: SidA/IucD/PvdA family monooxygenase [Streptosporangiales bacterium]|nr:SidA/IucD/PvdA family monooxygenase [Streptosporangiales bacterium]